MFRHCLELDRERDRRDFECGMDELFSTMFDTHILLYLMDDQNTPKNDVYGETLTKIYKEPVYIAAKVEIGREHGEEPEKATIQTATITVPNLQLNFLRIPHRNPKELEILKRAILIYKDYRFLVDEVRPDTHVSGTFLFYKFFCTSDYKDTTRYILPKPKEGCDCF